MRRALTFGCGTTGLVILLAGVLIVLGGGPMPLTTPTIEGPHRAVTKAVGIASGADGNTSGYLFGITSIAEDMERSLARFTVLMTDPRVEDTAWRLDVATQLMIWQESYADAQTLIPPPELAEAHTHALDGLRRYDDISRVIDRGMVDQDFASIAAAASALTE